MQNKPIQLAVVDMAGTTVADDGLVVNAFEMAATAVGVPESGPERERARQYVLDTMGQSKISVFRALFGSEELAQQANAAFERAYEQLIDEGKAAPIAGAREAISRLRENGIQVALPTGFSGTTQEKLPASPEQMSLRILIPAFMISELKRAFEIGFLLFLPFLIIDLVVASVLMSMGMMMLPPVVVSLPFKLIFFVLVDGWSLVAGSLVQSYGGG